MTEEIGIRKTPVVWLLTRSYVAYAFYALVIITVAPDLIYVLFEVDTNPRVWSALQIAACLFGLVGRIVSQPPKNAWRRRIVIGLTVSLLCAFAIPAMAKTSSCEQSFDSVAFDLISRWEGERKSGEFHVSYFDTIAKPPLWTVCYGHTKTAGPGQYKTDDECRALLIEEIEEYRRGLHVYLTDKTRRYRLTNHREAAYTSLAYNVGIRAAGRSTATRRLNAGNIRGGCDALTWWNKAGGRVVRGLVNRRSAEKEYCLKGAI